MSLINQMLRDLDERQVNTAGDTNTQDNIDPVKTASPNPGSKSKMVFISLLLLSLLLIIYLTWQQQGGMTALESTPPVESTGSILKRQVTINEETAETTILASSENKLTPVAIEPAASLALENQDKVDRQPALIGRHSPSVSTQENISTDTPQSAIEDEETDTALIVQSYNEQPEGNPDSLITKPSNDKTPAMTLGRLPVIELMPDIMIPRRISIANVSLEKEVEVANVKVKHVSKYSSTADAQHSYETGLRLIEIGRLAEAEQALLGALETIPAHLEARHLLAMLYIQTDRRSKTVSLLEQGLTIRPGHLPFVTLRARLHADAGELKQA